MQPYFFPYFGYFSLIASVDRWIVFDIVNYKKRSWMNRNRILCERKGWQYISYPVKDATLGTKIFEVCGNKPEKARQSIVGQLGIYKKKAPFVQQAIDIVNETFALGESGRLVDINVSGLQAVSERLGFDIEFEVLSRMDLDLPEIEHAGQWALAISSVLGAETYINPVGGREIFSPEEFSEAGIELAFSDPEPLVYDVTPFSFEPGLSILDALCWLPADEVSDRIKDGARVFSA